MERLQIKMFFFNCIDGPDGRVSYFDTSNESGILEMEVPRFGLKSGMSRTRSMLRIGKQVLNGKMSCSPYKLKCKTLSGTV